MSKRFTTEDFILKGKESHKGIYDYSKVNYINNLTPVIIICPIHGEFSQKPVKHLNGLHGCPKCSGRNKTTEEFNKECEKIHNYIYDYSKVIYINAHSKITIICKEHGEFQQKAYQHLQGSGCPKCSHRSFKYTTEEFIERGNIKHNNKFDYSNVVYLDNSTPVIIICPIHGEFNQSPDVHLRSSFGCPKCSDEQSGDRLRKSNKQFIDESKIIHNNIFDYSKTEYITAHKKVIIICPEHGEFSQTPNSHLKGIGCPKCGGHGFNYLLYKDAQKFVQELGIKTQREYFEWWKKNRPNFLPLNIDRYYHSNN
jgi:Zn finger protein HypA/HybF involved in hydrogenase expression